MKRAFRDCETYTNCVTQAGGFGESFLKLHLSGNNLWRKQSLFFLLLIEMKI